jgi:hypothetical protein
VLDLDTTNAKELARGELEPVISALHEGRPAR